MWHFEDAKVDAVADGWVRFYANAAASSQGTECPFTYGVDVGVGWGKKAVPLASTDPKAVISGSSYPAEETQYTATIVTDCGLCPAGMTQRCSEDFLRLGPSAHFSHFRNPAYTALTLR